MKLPFGRWSALHESCIECRTQIVPHHGGGLCVNCYGRTRPWQWRRRRPGGYLEKRAVKDSGGDMKALLKRLKQIYPTEDWRAHLSPETRAILEGRMEAKEREGKTNG